jgi:hypothetical protein
VRGNHVGVGDVVSLDEGVRTELNIWIAQRGSTILTLGMKEPGMLVVVWGNHGSAQETVY